MNFSWKSLLIALAAITVTGCSSEVTPPPEQPQVSPVSSPSVSVSPDDKVDLWEAWRLPNGKTGVDLDAVNARYGLNKSWATTEDVNQRGYPIIGLTKDQGCVVLFSSYIGGETRWPMTIVVLQRYQAQGTEPEGGLQASARDIEHAAEQIALMSEQLGCSTPA